MSLLAEDLISLIEMQTINDLNEQVKREIAMNLIAAGVTDERQGL